MVFSWQKCLLRSSAHFLITLGFLFFLVKFIPRYFVIFHVVVNGIFFLISLSDSLLLVYRISTDFSILTLYPTTVVIDKLQQLFGSVIKYFLYTVSCHL